MNLTSYDRLCLQQTLPILARDVAIILYPMSLRKPNRNTLATWPGALMPVVGTTHAGSSVLNSMSDQSLGIENLWWWMFYGFSAAFVITTGLLFFGLWHHRQQLSEKASFYLVVVAGVVIPLITVIALVGGSLTLGHAIAAKPPDNTLTIKVIGRLWWWEIHYLNASGSIIATTANEMYVPKGQPVKLLLTSRDVIHSFWVPELHGKTDMLPGRINTKWFTATETGVFRGQCAEFCGTQHALMLFTARSVLPVEFQTWLSRQQQDAAVPITEQETRGQRIFLQSDCAGCHSIRGTSASGKQGPDLTHFGLRETLAAGVRPNNTGHLAGWISDPQSIKPGNKMPRTLLQPQQLIDLVAYLQSLR